MSYSTKTPSYFIRRIGLLASVASVALLAAPAMAESVSYVAKIDAVAPDPQIVIADPGTPTTDLDPDYVTGIGQMVTDIGGGYLGLCTGTLINPRTVIFAAHCVNDNAPEAYGAANGGIPISFGFANNNIPGLINWYFAGPGQYQTDTANAIYNSNWVNYHPGSLEPAANSFLYSDIAMAALDTPAADIPTWALMFSPVPDPGTITADGTGYHVQLVGYGNNGTGSTGSTAGIDYRRHIANNTLGALASLDTFETFLFGSPNGLYQNLYWIDFDDPLRGTASASPYDFNAWRDNAVENEGITTSGDSGGPLILDDTYDTPVVIGVLSGGYTQFFYGQPPNGYGTASFYQPLYLYWDWIAANNPYHYVTAAAGDGAWEDGSHWVSMLDPNYRVLDSNGNLINGIPTALGTGTTAGDGYGQACYQTNSYSDCYDVASGTETINSNPIGTTANDKGVSSVTGLFDADPTAQSSNDPSATATSGSALPTATIDNGLPGATDFVPNNSDGDPLNGVKPRYFDVTLAADGTTTLSSDVIIDRLTIAGTGTALDIHSDGSLTSLIDINQYSGMMRVDGTLTTLGDFFLMSGGLQGSGTINTPYFTSMAGVIAPGGVGKAGTLTFNGNVILANGNVLLVDLGSNESDQLVVQATNYVDDGNGNMIPVDGIADIGGTIAFGAVDGDYIRYNDTYTIVTAEGGIQGQFVAPGPISAILTPHLNYSANSVTLSIDAATYASVINPASPTQSAFASLLDQNRAQYSKFADLYGPLDLQSQATIRTVLESFAPTTQPLSQSLGTAAMDTNARLTRNRLASFKKGQEGGTVAYYGAPAQVVGALAYFEKPNIENSGMGNEADEPRVVAGALPDDMNAFFAGGYVDGHNTGAPTAAPYSNDDFNGFYLAAGLEKDAGNDGFVGASLFYSHLNGETGNPMDQVDSNMFMINVYAANRLKSGIGIDAQIGAGSYGVDTERMLGFGNTVYKLSSHSSPFILNGEVGVDKQIKAGSNLALTPRMAMRYAKIDFGQVDEEGGGPALQYTMQGYDSLQARLGLRIAGHTGKGSDNKDSIRPYLTGTYVHDFKDKPDSFAANFVGGIGQDVMFALPGSDQDWGEIGAGIQSEGKVSFSLSVETTVGRSDISYQNYRAAISIKF